MDKLFEMIIKNICPKESVAEFWDLLQGVKGLKVMSLRACMRSFCSVS